jgi:hypothetical protein
MTRSQELDTFVWGEVCRHLKDPAVLTAAYAHASADGGVLEEGVWDAQANHLERRKRDLIQEETRLLDA